MIFVSSSCLKNKKVSDSIELLAQNGVQNIELSGGTDYYENIIQDIINLKEKYNLNYLVHNYFPPPKEHFVLNLASLDEKLFQKSLDFYKESVELAIMLGCKKYGLHAGFFVNPKVNEIGMNLGKSKVVNTQLVDKNEAISKFVTGLSILKNAYEKEIDLYIENNSFSNTAVDIYDENPCMLTCFEDYVNLKKEIDFKLLFDVAHLKVACNSLKLNFEQEFYRLFEFSDYIHLSDNDSKVDSNLPLSKDSFLYKLLKQNNFSNKIVTLEINVSIEEINNSIKLVKELF